MGYKKPEAIRMVLKNMGVDPSDELVEDIHVEFVNQMMDHYEYSPDVKPMKEAENVFLQLKKRE
jgi:hypothetical protein